MPKVGIVISNYNGWQDTLVCLDSLQKQTYKDFEIILLDDASPNDSVAQLQDKLPANTVFLPQEQNLGFAAVNNVGMRRALADGCDYVLLLNNDTAVAPDMLETLLRETPAGAVSCPKMLFMNHLLFWNVLGIFKCDLYPFFTFLFCFCSVLQLTRNISGDISLTYSSLRIGVVFIK